MRKKIRASVYVYEDSWNELHKYIDCSKSEWVCEQVERKVNQHDDIAEIDRKLNEIAQMQEKLNEEFKTLTEEKQEVLKQRELNEQNFEVMNKAMNTIRLVANNQGYIEKTRIEFFANKFNISYSKLKEQIDKENITVKDIKQRDDTDVNEAQPY